MAIDLPETDLTRVQRWCQQRIPEDAQHQVRLEHEVRGHDVILVPAATSVMPLLEAVDDPRRAFHG